MSDDRTDSDWESFGKTDPYWAVLTGDRFRRENLDPEGLGEFFASGEAYVDQMFQTVRERLDSGFTPRRALDFGCGVGRLVVPLAQRCESVVGVDVSESMLQEARDNCRSRQLGNVTLVRGDDELSGVAGPFDLVNSYIVLQHIPCRRGLQIFRHLVELLGDGGVGVIHLTYSKAALGVPAAGDAGYPPPDGLRHHLAGLRRAVKRRRAGLFADRRPWRRGADRTGGAGPAVPDMQMNPYALNPIFHSLQAAGVREIYSVFTDHGGNYGVVLYFRKRTDSPYRIA